MKSKVDQKAIPFTILDTQGNTHTLVASAGRWLLLMFHRHLG